jgi:flagellar hook-associated protein 1 FlgK
MSLISALNISKSALVTQQAAISVTSNNIANSSDPNYAREVANTSPGVGTNLGNGITIGSGIDLTSVSRQIDQALNERLNSANSDASSASQTQQWLTQIQSSFNALSGNDIDSQLSTFFSDWSTLASNPTATGAQSAVIDDGQTLASTIQNLNSSLETIGSSITSQISTQVSSVNQLTSQIASLNKQILGSGGSSANTLLDQRDGDISSLSQLMNISTVQQGDGTVNVYAGSQLLVQGISSNALTSQSQTTNGVTTSTINFASNGAPASVTSGSLGGLLQVQSQGLNSTLQQLNTMATGLISAVNQIQSQGQGTAGLTSVTSTNAVTDPTDSLGTDTGLATPPTNGSFTVNVNGPTGAVSQTVYVKVGVPGTPDTTLNSLAAQLNTVAGVTASVSNGKLSISAASGSTLSFQDDSSGVLSSLGINTFFTGTDASDIGINSAITTNPSLVAVAGTDPNNTYASNGAALSMAALANNGIPSLGGSTISDAYEAIVNNVATQTSNAGTNSDAATQTQSALQSQQQSVSGVSQDEEAINVIQEQTAYQGAAQVINAINQMMQTLLAM